MGANEEGEYDYVFKVVMIGDSGVGKTNVLGRYLRNEFTEKTRSTIGLETHTKLVKVPFKRESKTVSIQIWDTAGEERYAPLAKSYYRGIHAAIVVYDITKKETFQRVDHWLAQLRSYSGDGVITMLVGNKCDLKHLRAVDVSQATAKAAAEQMLFMETSALDSTNIQEAYTALACEFLKQNYKAPVPQGDKISSLAVAGSTSATTPVVLVEEQNPQQPKRPKGCCY